MPQDPKARPTSESSSNAWIYGAAALLTIVVLPALVPAVAAWYLLRGRLGRYHFAAIFAAGVASIVLSGGDHISSWADWMSESMVGRPGDVAWLALIAFGAVWCGLIGVLFETKATRFLPKFLRREKIGRTEFLPSDKQRAKLAKLIAPPVDGFSEPLPDAEVDGKVGDRSFPIGLDRNGSAFYLTERESGVHGMIFGSTGSGKALALDTPIPTPTGWTTMGELRVGDLVLDETGAPTEVVFVTETQLDRRCFEVRFDDGSVIVADADHRWVTTTNGYRTAVVTTDGIAATLRTRSGHPNHSIRLAGALRLPEVAATESAYAAGYAAAAGLPFEPALLRGSPGQRAEMLAGVLDATDHGGPSSERVYGDRQLLAVVEELVVSLGGVVTHSETADGVPFVSFAAPAALRHARRRVSSLVAAGHTPAATPARHGALRRRVREMCRTRAPRDRKIVDVVQVESVPVRCIQVAADSHMYLAGRSMVPTHNTETIKQIAAGLGDLGWDGIIIDLKEDTKPGGLRDWVKEYAEYHGVYYQELRLSDPNPAFWFDVLSGLARDEARDAIMSLTSFDDDYYQQISKKLMGQLLRLMYIAHEVDPTNCPRPNLYEIARILGQQKLGQATKRLLAIASQRVPAADFEMLQAPSQVEQGQAHSWGAKLGQVFQTEAGERVLRPDSNRPMFDVTRRGLMYVGLDSQGKADLTRLVSSAVLQRLSADSAQRTTGANTSEVRPKFIIVDEANWVDRTIVQNLLSRARSAGISMWLATQGPKDWIDKEGDDFGKLGQNVNISVFMRQGDPKAAELCAEYLGMQTFHEKSLQHHDGDIYDTGSVRRETDWRVTPDQLRELEVGEAFVRVNVPKQKLSWVKVTMRSATRPVPGRRELTSIAGLTEPVVPAPAADSSDGGWSPAPSQGPPAGGGYVSPPPPV